MTAPIFAAAVIVGLYLLATVILLAIVRRNTLARVTPFSRIRENARSEQEPLPLPDIPGYTVWQGRRLLHARHEGCPADARADHRPWHVVASSADELVLAAR